MVGSGLGIVIELIVSLLLVVTISYCFIVNRKLTALRADQSGLRLVIGELNRSTERAELAIQQMRQTAQQVDTEMAGHLETAHSAREDLIMTLERTREAQALVEKLTDVDLKALRLVSEVARESALPNDQMKVARQLKEKRLSFGRVKVASQA